MLWVFSIVTQPVGAEYGLSGPDVAADLVPGKHAVFGLDGADHAAGEPGHHRKLVIEDVGARIADHFLAVLGEQLDRDGVAHGAGGDEQGGFLAGDFGGALFEAVDGGVFAVHVVADLARRSWPGAWRAWAG